MSRFHVLEAHSLPVQKVGQSLTSISLVDSLPSGLLGEVEHDVRELIQTLVDRLHSTVDDVDTIIGWVLDEILHITTESGKVGGDGWNSHDGTFGRCVTPGLVV